MARSSRAVESASFTSVSFVSASRACASASRTAVSAFANSSVNAGAHRFAALDFLDKPGGLGGDHGAFLVDFLEPGFHPGKAIGGVARARLPCGHILALRGHPFARDGQRLIVRGKRGGGRLRRFTRGIIPGARCFQRHASAFRIGQFGLLCLGGFEIGESALALFLQILVAVRQFLAPRCQSFTPRLGLVQRAQRLPLGFGTCIDLSLLRHEIALQVRKFGLCCLLRGGGGLYVAS